jgi:hypothetical protein
VRGDGKVHLHPRRRGGIFFHLLLRRGAEPSNVAHCSTVAVGQEVLQLDFVLNKTRPVELTLQIAPKAGIGHGAREPPSQAVHRCPFRDMGGEVRDARVQSHFSRAGGRTIAGDDERRGREHAEADPE